MYTCTSVGHNTHAPYKEVISKIGCFLYTSVNVSTISIHTCKYPPQTLFECYTFSMCRAMYMVVGNFQGTKSVIKMHSWLCCLFGVGHLICYMVQSYRNFMERESSECDIIFVPRAAGSLSLPVECCRWTCKKEWKLILSIKLFL